MTNNNLLLYGSVARGDSTKNSDIDLLTVGSDISNKFITNQINVSYYNISKLEEMARSGSLFIYHLNQEAKILYDEGGTLNRIIYKDFSLKRDYNQDIYFSYVLLKEIILAYNNTMNFSFANSKIAWCLRTIYSGLGANSGIPIFSMKSILDRFGKDSIEFLGIKKKSTNQNYLLPKISAHINDIVVLPEKGNLHFKNDLLEFKEKVLSTIRNNKSNFEFDY
jgi:predicted nucleotidyltransferase